MSLLNIVRNTINHPLNQGRALETIIRFAKWQICSRLVPGAIVYNWVNDSKFLVRTGETGLTGNIYAGLDEFSEMAFLLHFLRDEDLFIDVGANVGSYTILACSAIGARGIAFEPIPNSFYRLVENIRLNNLDERVKAIDKGVGAQEERIAFTSDRDTMNRVLASEEQYVNTITVQVTSLDAALDNNSPALIKIDVEGFETPVIRGAHETLQQQTLHSVIMELNGRGSQYGFDESEILEVMAGHGFDTYSYDPFERTLASLGGKNLDSKNTLFIRDRLFVEERLRSSPKFELNGRQI